MLLPLEEVQRRAKVHLSRLPTYSKHAELMACQRNIHAEAMIHVLSMMQCAALVAYGSANGILQLRRCRTLPCSRVTFHNHARDPKIMKRNAAIEMPGSTCSQITPSSRTNLPSQLPHLKSAIVSYSCLN